MRILITTQVFPPEQHPTAVMVQELASYLRATGHEVTVACGYPHHPEGKLLGKYHRCAILREKLDGIDVVRGWHFLTRSARIPARGLVMLSQALGTTAAAHFAGVKPDIVVNFGPPLIGPLLASTVAWRWGASLVTVIYDIYPDVAVETGKVTNRTVIAIAQWAERRIYRTSQHLIVLSEGFRRTLTNKGLDPTKVNVVPVWLDPQEIRPSPRLNSWRTEQGIDPTSFVVLYAGTIGLVSGAEVMVDVADRLRGEKDILFLFVGGGQLKAALEKETRRRRLGNVQFCAFQERERLNEIQAIADVSVVTLAKDRARTSVPSKVIGYMAAGKPIVASVDRDSDTARCVIDGRCGIVVPPGDATGIAEAILSLKRAPEARIELGESGRRRFDAVYAAPAVLDSFASLLEHYAVMVDGTRTRGSQRLMQAPTDGRSETSMVTRAATTVIRPMASEDVPRVVQIHLTAFAEFFLTFLGPRFLRLLYEEAVRMGQIALVADVDRCVVGMAIGSVQPASFYGELIRSRLIAFGVAAVPAVVRRPAVAARVRRALSRPSTAAKPPGTATLMSLAVEPAGQGHGAGSLLVAAFAAEARRRGATTVDLTTDRYHNDLVNSFYLRAGFQLSSELVTAEGRALNEYQMDLSLH